MGGRGQQTFRWVWAFQATLDNTTVSPYYINVTKNLPVSPDALSNDELKPYSGPGFVYTAAVLTSDEYDPSQPYTLGSFTSTFFEDITYINTPLTVELYHCFVCAFTTGPVS